MAGFFFSPTGVFKYYLALAKALDLPLGAPTNLAVATAAGGALPAATYFYKVTAIDGAGGETTASNEVSQITPLNNKNTLTWNVVPNATGYNVYRSTTTNTELLLVGTATAVLPVPQVVPGTLSVSFVDDGTPTAASPVYNLLAAPNGASLVRSNFAPPFTRWTFTTTVVPVGVVAGRSFTIAGASAPFNGTYTASSVLGNSVFATTNVGGFPITQTGGGGTLTVAITPPVVDTTQQTALFKMPVMVGSPATLPVAYNNSNVVALFPADPLLPSPDGGGGGGSGGSGGTGGGGSSGGAGGGPPPTPSGGIPGNVGFIPEIVQFSNRAIIALGNGFPGQVFSDPTTLTNPATTSAISASAVDAFGVVTITVPTNHGIPAGGDGANVVIAGMTPAAYNGTFVVIKRLSATQYNVRNIAAIGVGVGTAFGTSTTTTIPFISTFTQGYPIWATGVTYLTGDLITPTVLNGHYYKAIQGGISAAAQPIFPTATGSQVAENSPSKVIWQEAGTTNSTAPPPPGVAHIKVFAGSLWAWNTSPTNTANGLDGPTAIRMSDSNNPNSWNPINQAFLDKDDGTEGSGLTPFTISGFGIPPEGSLVPFKQNAGYQIVGVFGSPNFLIQRIKSSLGCTAPRTIQFTTGFGITRFTNLGFAVFDGMNDRVISEDITPYIFPSNQAEVADITTADYTYISLAWATQTSYPPMYVAIIPIGNSAGALTRGLCYDLVLKAWVIVDFPFPISCAFQATSDIATPVTVLGTFNDGGLHRWQAGDPQWDNSITTPGPSDVVYSTESPLVLSKRAQGSRFYCRQVRVTGNLEDALSTMAVSLKLQGESEIAVLNSQFNLGSDGTVVIDTAVNEKVISLSAIIRGVGEVGINNYDFQVKPESTTVGPRLT